MFTKNKPLSIVANTAIIPLSEIKEIDISEIMHMKVRILHGNHWTTIEGIPAIDAVYLFKPSALEGRRFRWVRNAWAFHNLIAHPLMQILAFFKRYELAMRIHDATIPRPIGITRKHKT
ncbi:MAG: hypothetical protein Q7R79_01735 [bacterium]|nr:hypothetical protein [bacterium]